MKNWTIKAHTNPSWSRDGRRIYYLKANQNGNAECWYAEWPTKKK